MNLFNKQSRRKTCIDQRARNLDEKCSQSLSCLYLFFLFDELSSGFEWMRSFAILINENYLTVVDHSTIKSRPLFF